MQLYSVVVARNGYIRNVIIKGSMSKVAKSFICRGCLNLVTSAVRTSVDIRVGAKLESVDKFCLLYTSPSPRDRQKSRMPSSA